MRGAAAVARVDLELLGQREEDRLPFRVERYFGDLHWRGLRRRIAPETAVQEPERNARAVGGRFGHETLLTRATGRLTFTTSPEAFTEAVDESAAPAAPSLLCPTPCCP